MAHPEWETVYVGQGLELRRVQEEIEAAGIPVVATAQELAPYSGMVARSPEFTRCAVSVPPDVLESRREELESIIQRVTGAEAGDAAAIREAEEDYDVRGCPHCVLYLHETFAQCPGCGSELVPAVEIFAQGQAEPDRVIVATGTAADMKALSESLRAAGFGAEASEVEDWPVAAVDLPWEELRERTEEAEALLPRPAARIRPKHRMPSPHTE